MIEFGDVCGCVWCVGGIEGCVCVGKSVCVYYGVWCVISMCVGDWGFGVWGDDVNLGEDDVM